MTARELKRSIWLELSGAPFRMLRPLVRQTSAIHYASGGRILIVDQAGATFEVLVVPVAADDPDAQLIAAFDAGLIPEG